MLTLFIRSQWTKVYSKVSINLLKCSKTIWPVSSKQSPCCQAGWSAAVCPSRHLYSWAAMGPSSPVSSCGSRVPLFLLGNQSRACSKEKELQCNGPALSCCVPWGVGGCSPELQARLAPLTVCGLHRHLLFRLFPHPPWPPCSMDRTRFWSCTAFKMPSVVSLFNRNLVTQNRNLAFIGRGFFQCTPSIS